MRRRLTLGLAAFVLLTVLLAGIAWLWLERGREGRDRQALETLAQAELLRQEARSGDNPGQWAEALALARRAEALLEQGTGRPGPPERARTLLRALEEEQADRRLLVRVEKIQFVKVQEDNKAFMVALRAAVHQYVEAFTEYGLEPGVVPPEEAAARIRQRPLDVQERIFGALDDWLSLVWLWVPSEVGTVGWVEEVVTAADHDPWRQRLRGMLRTRDQRELQRLADEVVVARQPPWTLMLLGMLLRSGGLPQQGLELMRRAQEKYPDDFWVNYELAWQLDQDPDKTDDPVRFYRVAAALRPDSPLVRLTLANSLTLRGEVDKAITVLREAADRSPNVAVLHLKLGDCLARKGDRDEAIRAFRRAIELAPDNVRAYRYLGLQLDERGDRAGLNQTIDQLQQLIKRKPNEPDAYSALGDLLLRKKDLDGARVAYRRWRDALRPDDFDAHFDLGRHLKAERVFDEALAVFRHCEELATKSKRGDLREGAARAALETEQLQLLTAGREHASRRE